MKKVRVLCSCGELEGDEENGIRRFLGIRYATAERFSYPREIVHWDGLYDAHHYGDAPLQKMAFDQVDCGDPQNFSEHETMNGVSCSYSEDCLNLNIWAPENAHDAPVLISIFGGGEVTGRTQELPYDGTALAQKGVIVVFISYRLNIFGFLALKALAQRDGKSGNYAYYDQFTAIEWVRHNICAFGGNPDNLTLAGQSAGAANCETQIKSPLNRGHIKNAVIQSSAGFTTVLKAKDNREQEYNKWQKIFDQSGCKTLNDFLALPSETLFRLFEKESASKPGFCTTIYDEAFGSEAKNQPCGTNIMIGITSEDVFPAVLYVFSELLSKRQRKMNVRTYRYFFQRQLPGDNRGAWHSSDLWYFYGALKKCWRPFDSADEELADLMQRYTVNFMKTGDPNGEDLTQWNPVGTGREDSLILDAHKAVMGNPGLGKLVIKTLRGLGSGY